MNTRFTSLSAALVLPFATAAQGNFDDHVVWERTIRFTADFTYVDDDGDGLAALWAAAPGSATLYRYDANGARSEIRGPSGVRFGHEFAVDPIVFGKPTVAVARGNGVEELVFFDPKTRAGVAPSITVPSSFGALLELQGGNFDGDADRELAIIGSTGLGFYDGATQTIQPIATGLPPGTLSPVAVVRDRSPQPDSIIVPSSATPIVVREFDVYGNATTLDTLPNTASQAEDIAMLNGEPVVSTTNGSFTLPGGRVWFFNRPTTKFKEIITGNPDQRFSRITRPNAAGRWFAVRKTFGGIEEVQEIDGPSGTPRTIIQGPANIGLDLAKAGERDMFPGNTPHLIVRQGSLSLFSAYQTTSPVDTRIRNGGQTSGSSFQVDISLGAPGAGASVVPVLSFTPPATIQLGPLGPMSFFPDITTQLSVPYLGGPFSADGQGDVTVNVVVPSAPGTSFRANMSIGWLAFPVSSPLMLNQTGALTYVDIQ